MNTCHIRGSPETTNSVASEKNGVPSDLAIDHFKCYEAAGDPLYVIVDLVDQFGVNLDVLVGAPELFCNPVDKNGEGILDPEAHLTCYDIEDGDDDNDNDDDGDSDSGSDSDGLNVQVNNQFGEQVLEVEDSELLCVPSEKLGFTLHIDDDDDDDD